jgi:Osmosensitive K+ channel histidine kinase
MGQDGIFSIIAYLFLSHKRHEIVKKHIVKDGILMEQVIVNFLENSALYGKKAALIPIKY